MITQLKYLSLFEDSAHMREDCLLDDLKLVMICAGISMARESGNPIWAQSNDMDDKFNNLFTKYCEILKEVSTDDKFELKYTCKLCEYIGFTISIQHFYGSGNQPFMRFHRSTPSNFTEASDFLKETLDNNAHQEFFRTLQPHTDFTNLYVNARNFCDIISDTPVLKENLLSAIERLEEDRIGATEFFKMAKKYAKLCVLLGS